MNEISLEREEVKVFRVFARCPDCVSGRLIYTGISFMTAPAKFEHKCANVNCEKVVNLQKIHPFIAYEKIEA